MKRISRNIYYYYVPGTGTVYNLTHKGHVVDKFTSFSECLKARRHRDFEKKRWNDTSHLQFDGESYICKDLESFCFYVKQPCTDYEELVSDLYQYYSDAVEVKKFLDEANWSSSALNTLKKQGLHAVREYAGILPLIDGYLIIDVDHNEYGLYPSLDEAVARRNELREEGVMI